MGKTEHDVEIESEPSWYIYRFLFFSALLWVISINVKDIGISCIREWKKPIAEEVDD